ncbi:MAG: tRNA 2-selenouridine(34) synthase MnmH [Pseudomonadota bacterium]
MYSARTLSDLRDTGFDQIIDVRSPAEFSEDHVPGAINLPVLNNEERAEVGTIYKQIAPFEARKIGASIVFRNTAQHIEETLSQHDGRWRPLVYCWRGGQRSAAFAWMLQQIGWRADTIAGGYKSYRSLVAKMLYNEGLDLYLVRLGGYTGTAKTDILKVLTGMGVQVIDLEALACHRGSLLGGLDVPQPSQRSFESGLAAVIDRIDPSRPVVVEAESNSIGSIKLPPSFWQAMKAAPMLEIEAPLQARAAYLAKEYHTVLADGPDLKAKLSLLRAYRGKELVSRWHKLIDENDRVALCASLAAEHYDPAYDKSASGAGGRIAARFNAPDLSVTARKELAEQIAKWLQTTYSSPL